MGLNLYISAFAPYFLHVYYISEPLEKLPLFQNSAVRNIPIGGAYCGKLVG
jgi:hypothetical protein